jgi:hypothetical protein
LDDRRVLGSVRAFAVAASDVDAADGGDGLDAMVGGRGGMT